MTVNDNTQPTQQQLKPKLNPDLKSLDKLVGTWRTSGGVQGTVRFELMEGSFFLIQHVDLEHNGRKIKGIEIIGKEQKSGAEPSEGFKSRFYSFLDGTTSDYVYEPDDDGFTIWMGEKGSSGYMKGKVSEDGNTFTGEWTYPGGGYKATGTRVE